MCLIPSPFQIVPFFTLNRFKFQEAPTPPFTIEATISWNEHLVYKCPRQFETNFRIVTVFQKSSDTVDRNTTWHCSSESLRSWDLHQTSLHWGERVCAKRRRRSKGSLARSVD